MKNLLDPDKPLLPCFPVFSPKFLAVKWHFTLFLDVFKESCRRPSAGAGAGWEPPVPHRVPEVPHTQPTILRALTKAAEGCGKIAEFNETWSQGRALELSAKPSLGEGTGKMGFFLMQ